MARRQQGKIHTRFGFRAIKLVIAVEVTCMYKAKNTYTFFESHTRFSIICGLINR